MNTTTIHIEGMTCDHCVHAVKNALSSVQGVTKAVVNRPLKQAVVESEGLLDVSAAVKAVEEAGYKIIIP